MKIYQYESYDQYVEAQIEANIRKEERVWVQEPTIRSITSFFPEAQSVLCHGTRNGRELQYFRKYLPDARILGTEISPTATKYADTIQHDFNKPLPSGETFDVVYSNAFDHSPCPDVTLREWYNQLNEGGILCIEISFHYRVNLSKISDPLELSYEEFIDLASVEGNVVSVHPIVGSRHPSYLFILEKK